MTDREGRVRQIRLMLLLFLGCLVTSAAKADARYDAGRAAFSRFDVAEATATLTALATDGSAKLAARAEAAAFLADIALRIDRDAVAAKRWVEAAKNYGIGPAEAAALEARLLILEGEPRKAVPVALAAVEKATDDRAKHRNTLLYTDAMIKAYDSPTAKLARRALAINAQMLRAHLDAHPGSAETAMMLLDFSVRLGDGDTILHAIRALVPGVEKGEGPVSDAYKALSVEISGWLGSTVDTDRRRRIVLALAKLHLASAASYIAKEHPSRGRKAFLAEPDVARVVAYADFLEGLKAELEAAYRVRVRGGEGDSVAARFDKLAAAFIAKVPEATAGKAYEREAFTAYLAQGFGARLHWTEDGRDLMLGHVIGREENEVSGFGVTTSVETEHIGFMTAKGYDAYILGDAAGAPAGWSDGETVVRAAGTGEAAYNGAALWGRCGGKVDAPKRAREIRDMAAGDAALVTGGGIAFLPGLRARLEWQACRSLMHMLKRSGIDEDRIEGGFIGEVDFALSEGNVAGYQARLALDRARLGDAWAERGEEEHEFHARLAQVLTSPRPRLALAESIITPGLAGEGAQARARARVVKGLLDWMKKHAGEVMAYDAGLPAMVQLDHLSDDQIRKALTTLDPLAGKNTG
jgi:hypothetical protein